MISYEQMFEDSKIHLLPRSGRYNKHNIDENVTAKNAVDTVH